MAQSAESALVLTQEPSPAVPPKIKSIRTIAELPGLTKIPATHIFSGNPLDQAIPENEDPVPIIDYSLLVSSGPHQRSRTIRDLAYACWDWGFFKVINHGVPERLMKSMIEDSFLVNTGDHLVVLSNGKYKSVLHRAVVNNGATRVSMAIVNAPLLDTVVVPAPELAGDKPAFRGMKYAEFLQTQQTKKLGAGGKSNLDSLRI